MSWFTKHNFIKSVIFSHSHSHSHSHPYFLSYLLLPLSFIYRSIIFIRRKLYRLSIFKSHRLPVPVIIVGNITVGGTGKTPLVIALTEALKKHGFHPGIISRGYRGKSQSWPQSVTPNSDPYLVGDEAVLMAKKTGVPVVVGPKRVVAAQKLLAEYQCDIIISDDGLQHYALERDIEIAVIDGERQLGNTFCLPAGPLREPPSRLKTVDFVVFNSPVSPAQYAMHFVIDDIVNMKNGIPFSSHSTDIIAIAGIGNPDRFFNTLRDQKIQFQSKIFPDHHHFQLADFNFLKKNHVVLMTEKDAVKCTAFADDRFYVVRGHAEIQCDFIVNAVIAASPVRF